ncbi:hypothetical protein GALL_546820 [mine drainage metagenome]|uniref:Uncharacterized protein n=1 Tax=mine drainage metagenome TaxID=410659 RepID=A0A1J5NX17_9ZZZZ
MPRRCEPRGGEPERADAVEVRPAHAVGVVVRVVHADLHRERDAQGEQRENRTRGAELGGRAGADEDRCGGCREGAGARTGDPLAGGGHRAPFVCQVVLVRGTEQ